MAPTQVHSYVGWCACVTLVPPYSKSSLILQELVNYLPGARMCVCIYNTRTTITHMKLTLCVRLRTMAVEEILPLFIALLAFLSSRSIMQQAYK